MKNREKVLDDLARLAGGGASIVSGLARNIREDIQSRANDFASNLDLVPREDFERLEAVLLETRRRVDEQEARIIALEKSLSPAKTKTTKPKK
jgi:BMFP domain-containing protein YqiC